MLGTLFAMSRQTAHIEQLENILDCAVDYLMEIRNEVDTTIEMLERCVKTARKEYYVETKDLPDSYD